MEYYTEKEIAEMKVKARVLLAKNKDKIDVLVAYFQDALPFSNVAFKPEKEANEVINDGILGDIIIHVKESSYTLSEIYQLFRNLSNIAKGEELKISQDVIVGIRGKDKPHLFFKAILYLESGKCKPSKLDESFLGCHE
jgi:hypothetical protein